MKSPNSTDDATQPARSTYLPRSSTHHLYNIDGKAEGTNATDDITACASLTYHGLLTRLLNNIDGN